MRYALAAFLRFALEPVFLFVGCVLLAVPLWLIRRYYPPAEKYIYGPLHNGFYAIGRTLGRLLRRLRGPTA
jgi:hypothetical protein